MQKPPPTTGPCEDSTPVVKFDAAPPLRPVPACDPALPVPSPSYDYPEPAPVATEQQLLPPPYVYVNGRTSVTCALWPAWHSGEPEPEGPESVVEEGKFSLSLSLTDFDIPSDSLYLIGKIVGSDQAPSRALIDNGESAALAMLFHIPEETASAIIARAADMRGELADMATAAAIEGLDCVWYNTEREAWCQDESGYLPALIGAYNPSVVPARSFSSPVSLEEANALADAAAVSTIECIWPCPEITVHCSDIGVFGLDPGDPDLATGGTVEVGTPDEGSTFYPGSTTRWRVNSVSVAQGTPEFNSLVSAEDARALARAWAESQLDCFYVNGPLTESCTGGSGESAGHVETPIIYDGVSTGNPVTVPAGTVASFDSWLDAHDSALLLAQGSLLCVYANDELVYSCDDSNSDTGSPAEIELHAGGGIYDGDVEGQSWSDFGNKNPIPVYVGRYGTTVNVYSLPLRSPSYHVRVPAHRFIGATRDEANQLAALFAISQLQCSYCSPDLEPFCPSDSVSYTQDVPGVPYVGEEPVIGAGGNWDPQVPLDDPSLGPDAPFPFCGFDPYQVIATADLVGSIPVANLVGAEPTCEYANAPVYAACEANTLGGGAHPPGIGIPQPPAPLTWQKQNFATREYHAEPTIRLSKNPVPECRTYNTENSTIGYIAVGYGEILAESQAIADQLASELALSKLRCVWGNPSIRLLCGAPSAYDGDGCTEHIEAGSPSIDGGWFSDSGSSWTPWESSEWSSWDSSTSAWVALDNDVDPGSKGSHVNPVVLPKDTWFSEISPYDAAMTAYLIAYSQLNCYWTNDRQRAACPNGEGNAIGTNASGEAYSAVYHYVVQAGTVVSTQSKEDANILAHLIAESELNCVYINEAQTGVDNCPYPCVAAKLYTIPKGTVTSSVSVNDANRTAAALAAAMTQCVELNGLGDCDIPSDSSSSGGSTSGGGGSGGSGGTPGACCSGILHNIKYTTFCYGTEPCFDYASKSHYVIIMLHVSVTQPHGCRRHCKQWGGRISVANGIPGTLSGGRWLSTGPAHYSFPLGLDGEGSCDVCFKVKPVQPCFEVPMTLEVFESGPRDGGGGGCGPAGGTCVYHHKIKMPGYCGIGCGSSGPSSGSSSSPDWDPNSSSPHSGSSSKSSSGSSKNAIVPSSYVDTGYVAWFITEAPEVLFFDIADVTLTGRITKILLDPIVLEGCEPGSVRICGTSSSSFRAVVERNMLVITASRWAWRRPKTATIMLVGTRRGFKGLRLPPKTKQEFLVNEQRLNPH